MRNKSLKLVKEEDTIIKHEQIEIIKQYIQLETNHALIIDGEYGIGKTHFYKELVSPELETISLPDNETKKFRPVYLSLFGLKNTEEISRLIFLELYPILKSKGLRIGAGVGKALLRGALNYRQWGDIDDYIEDVTPDSKDLINLEELVLCFDDLDRKSDALSLNEFYGYINFMVENFGIKIIVISNDKELKEEDKSEAVKLKEKVIGVHINYKPNVELTFNSILEERYKTAYRLYYKFLIENKDLVYNALKVNNYNFRSLIFFLEHFKLIFSSIEEVFQRDKKFKYKELQKKEAVLVCALAIAFEFKSGSLNTEEIHELENTDETIVTDLSFAFSKFIQKQETENEEEKKDFLLERLKKKYSQAKDLYLFKSIILYLLGVKSFKKDKLISELRLAFPAQDDNKEAWDAVLDRMKDPSYLNFSDKEYTMYANEILRYVDKGSYRLEQYKDVFHCLIRHNNFLEFGFPRLKERIKNGIVMGKENYTYNPSIRDYMHVSGGEEFYEDKLEIGNYCIEINEELKQKENQDKIDKLFYLFETDFNEFRSKTESSSSEYINLACWQYFDPKESVAIIEKMKNTDVFELSLYFRFRQIDIARQEKASLKEIFNLLKESASETKEKLKAIVVDRLVKELNELIRKIEVNETP